MNTALKPWRPGVTRRKAITIFAVSAALAATGRGSANAGLYEWTGIALGADARILLSTSDPEAARASIEAAMAEVARLEAIFSLFDENSELVRLNRDKRLPQASQDTRWLIALCRTVHAATGGLFDPSIQPLWRFYLDWFSKGPQRGMPPADEMARRIANVDFGQVQLSEAGLSLPAGAELSFNGVAQGYITDCVAQMLQRMGWRNVLIDMGEVRALDSRPDGADWQIKIREGARHVPLRNKALAVSAGESLVFSQPSGLTHILDPRTGLSPSYWRYIAVEHASAAVADALSTALYLADEGAIGRAAPNFSPVTIMAEDMQGRPFACFA
jgi:thiamine biosynthesis lipoprotein